MVEAGARQSKRSMRGLGVALAVAGVVLWRVAAYARPSAMVPVAEPLQLPLALLGLFFVACGLWAWSARPDRVGAVFLFYGLAAGVHWGGAVGAANPGLEVGILFLYLGISAASEAALLHLALIYPRGRRLGGRALAALYGLAGLTVAIAPLAGTLPRDVMGAWIAVVMGVASLLSIAAAILFLVRLAKADAETRRSARLPAIVIAFAIAALVMGLGGVGLLPGSGEAWNLAYGAIPLALAHAIARGGASQAGTRVRRAVVEDLAAVRELRLAALSDAPDEFESTWQEASGWSSDDWRAWFETRAVFVAQRDGENLGLATGMAHDGDSHAAFLGGMWVRPGARGRGVGDALVQAVLAWARERGFGQIVLHVVRGNQRARGLYERNGFRATGEEIVTERTGLRESEMKLDLRGKT